MWEDYILEGPPFRSHDVCKGEWVRKEQEEQIQEDWAFVTVVLKESTLSAFKA